MSEMTDLESAVKNRESEMYSFRNKFAAEITPTLKTELDCLTKAINLLGQEIDGLGEQLDEVSHECKVLSNQLKNPKS